MLVGLTISTLSPGPGSQRLAPDFVVPSGNRPLDSARRRTRKGRVALLQDLSPNGRAEAFPEVPNLGRWRGGPINRVVMLATPG